MASSAVVTCKSWCHFNVIMSREFRSTRMSKNCEIDCNHPNASHSNGSNSTRVWPRPATQSNQSGTNGRAACTSAHQKSASVPLSNIKKSTCRLKTSNNKYHGRCQTHTFVHIHTPHRRGRTDAEPCMARTRCLWFITFCAHTAAAAAAAAKYVRAKRKEHSHTVPPLMCR